LLYAVRENVDVIPETDPTPPKSKRNL